MRGDKTGGVYVEEDVAADFPTAAIKFADMAKAAAASTCKTLLIARLAIQASRAGTARAWGRPEGQLAKLSASSSTSIQPPTLPFSITAITSLLAGSNLLPAATNLS